MNPMQLLIQIMQGGKNPQTILQTLVNQNPQAQGMINQITNQMQQSGMTPKQFAQQLLKQNNIDINQIMNTANQNGIKL